MPDSHLNFATPLRVVAGRAGAHWFSRRCAAAATRPLSVLNPTVGWGPRAAVDLGWP